MLWLTFRVVELYLSDFKQNILKIRDFTQKFWPLVKEKGYFEINENRKAQVCLLSVQCVYVYKPYITNLQYDLLACKLLEILEGTDIGLVCSTIYSQTDKYTDNQISIYIYIQIYRSIDTHIYIYTDTQIYRYTNIQLYRYTDMQIYRYADIHIYRYTDTQIYRYTDTRL